ncbi:MAG: hypothetical protein ACK4GC_01390 [Paracoccaceae bacterium]
MRSSDQSTQEEDTDRPGPYDPDPVADGELWFLPAPDAAEAPSEAATAPARPLVDVAAWRAAQAGLSAPLADLAALFGALDERLRSGPPGWRQRLALMEVVDLGWWTGDRLPMDQLALWVGLRVGAVGDEGQALIRAGWAARRLMEGPAPDQGDAATGLSAGLAAFLGRAGQGEAVPDAIADLADLLAAASDLHPVTQAAILFHGWRMLGQASDDPALLGREATVNVEAAVLAARRGAKTGRGAALFLPLALTGPGALRASGSAAKRLEAWIAGAAQATLAALLHLDRLRAWEACARSATQDLSGRTPPSLIAALAAWPMMSAALAEQLTGASRAAVQRNLDQLAGRGLIREVTGQGRFRVWAAKV